MKRVKLLLEQIVARAEVGDVASERLKFAAAVAGFADMLRGGRHLGGWGRDDIAALAAASLGSDGDGYRGGFVALVVGRANCPCRLPNW